MSFCCREKFNLKKTLQIPRVHNVLCKNRRTGRRASLDASKWCYMVQRAKSKVQAHSGKGSMTVEASLIIPFFLCAVTALLYIFSYTAIQADESRKLTERAELLAITAGQAYDKDPYIRLYDADLVSLPFPVLAFGKKLVTKKTVVRAWVGYTGESFQNRAEQTIVYITPAGDVYHKSRDCTYIKLSIRQITAKQLGVERNQSGGRYTACIYCFRKDMQTGMVYITDYGTSYHSSAGCQGLKRTVTAVPLSETGGRHACSRCGKL